MSQLKCYRNKEIFLIYNTDRHLSDLSAKIYITSELMDAINYINKLTPSLDFRTKILHGILTKATTLSKNLRGKTAFVITDDVYDTNKATIDESDAQSDKELAEAVDMALLCSQSSDIDDIYILYGYEISIILTLDEEGLDEEIIDTCQKIVSDIKRIEALKHGELYQLTHG